MQKMSEHQVFEQDTSKYKKPFKKEIFEFVEQLVKEVNPSYLLDIGCASGDFPIGLDSICNNINIAGIDKSKELIEIANERKGSRPIEFYEIDIIAQEQKEEFNQVMNKYGEVVTILGTLQTFLDFRPLLDKVLDNPNTKTIIIHATFNDDPIDVQIFHRDLSLNETEFQSSRTINSKRTIIDYLHKKGIKDFVFMPFCMKSTLKRDPNFPNRNYHLFTQDGEKFSANGCRVFFKEYVLVINK